MLHGWRHVFCKLCGRKAAFAWACSNQWPDTPCVRTVCRNHTCCRTSASQQRACPIGLKLLRYFSVGLAGSLRKVWRRFTCYRRLGKRRSAGAPKRPRRQMRGRGTARVPVGVVTVNRSTRRGLPPCEIEAVQNGMDPVVTQCPSRNYINRFVCHRGAWGARWARWASCVRPRDQLPGVSRGGRERQSVRGCTWRWVCRFHGGLMVRLFRED